MNPLPIPKDIPLPLPANEIFLQVLLVVSFVAHILFVNLLVGSAALTLLFEWMGLKRKEYDALARRLSATITVNKSLAVVLGVAPLLLLNVLYTMHIYTANALTGTAWLLVLPGVIAAFLLLYLHHYTWVRLRDRKGIHLFLLCLPLLILLLIPLVFLVNTALMLHPEHWKTTRGFFSALTLPAIFPRYFHFVSASFIATSLFGVWYFSRKGKSDSEPSDLPSREEIRKVFYGIAFAVSIAQFVFGPWVLFSLPSKGFHASVLLAIGSGVLLSLPAVWLLWKEIVEPGRRKYAFASIVVLLSLTVFMMATGRHMFRGIALMEHRSQMKEATRNWEDASRKAAEDEKKGLGTGTSAEARGEELFKASCLPCHAPEKTTIGPSTKEIVAAYAGRETDLVEWTRKPGRKRPELSAMPAFGQLGDEKLKSIAKYLLK